MTTAPARTLRLGTRKSALARWQTNHIQTLLGTAHAGLTCEIVTFDTMGDRTLDKALPEIGGKGVFTAELEAALADRRIDVAVHSLKDLPTVSPDGLTVGAIPARADPRDVFVSHRYERLTDLPPGASLGTSSPRRAAQALAMRPDLRIESIRGNVDTRIRKAKEGRYGGVLLAAAGLTRLGFSGEITEYLSADVMIPAPGQGALAVQCRAGDQSVLRLLSALVHQPTVAATTAERVFLHALGGGCSAPIAAYGEVDTGGSLRLQGLVAAPDGTQVIRVSATGAAAAADEVAHEAAARAMADGAGALLA